MKGEGKKWLEDVCMATFMIAISHGRGVIKCFQDEGNRNGELFSEFVRDKFCPYFQQKE